MPDKKPPSDKSDTNKPIRVVAQSPDEVYFLAQDANKLVYIFDCSHRVGMPYWQARASGEVWGLAYNPMQMTLGVQRFEIRTVKLSAKVCTWLEHPDVELLVQQLEAPFFDERANIDDGLEEFGEEDDEDEVP